MIGQVLTLGGRSVVAPVIWGLLLLPFLVPAIVLSNPHLALAAVFPGVFFLLSLLRPVDRLTLRVDEFALVEEGGGEGEERIFSYGAIQTLRVAEKIVPADRPASPGVLLVGTESESLRIPAGPRTAELYRFLLERIPPEGNFEVPEKLQKHWQSEVEEFGEELVWGYAGRTLFPPRSRSSLWITAAVALISVSWIVGGALLGRGAEPWAVCGVIGLVVAAVVFPFQLKGGGDEALSKMAHASGLVISPRGLAMVHGPMTGKLRWDEIKKIEMAGSRNFQLVAAPTGLLLQVAGATIAVPDAFERPLAKIHQLMLEYWKAN